jgi:error-prone DNA polymerase
MASAGEFAELHSLSHFTFLRGASHPEELVETAAWLGYRALALTDECSVAGAVRAHIEARRQPLKLIIGSEFRLVDGLKLVLLAEDRTGYGQLCALITQARRQAPKGRYRLTREELTRQPLEHCLALWLPADDDRIEDGVWLAGLFPDRLWLGVGLFLTGRDAERLARRLDLGRALGIPAVACNDVHMHVRTRKPLQDTLTAIRLRKPLSELGDALYPNGERHLRPISCLARLYPPALLEETIRIAERCTFSLSELRYEYPRELVPEAYTPAGWLRQLVEAGLCRRWPDGAPDKVRRQIEHELCLISELAYEPYFLTVHDIVRFARERGILCQGRGSAANSAVCYALGITEVDPARLDLLFERFISQERNEPPDIDVDFEHERREEVIQYLYDKYGRGRAALAASVITYRTRSALRDVGQALGLGLDAIKRLIQAVEIGEGADRPAALTQAGFDPQSPELRRVLTLAQGLQGFPRHLSQHVGGFVIAADDLSRLVPIENAAMPSRTIIQWDKDDLEALGLLKVDILALGMLTALRKALDSVSQARGTPMTLADIPPEDSAVYAMLQRGESVGVFQVESRAQMAMLPRFKPKSYYDLVIQIALIRPGPIQGEMVHPYLARRRGAEPVAYPSDAVKRVLERTLGVPIFQEQVMQLAMVAAGFTAGEADQLRRAMAAWHRRGGLESFETRLLEGMRARGYPDPFIRQIFKQIQGFAEYGFPESHAASFALLAYASAWLKCHHPAAFTCALLNSQPMGFYAPAQLVQDARRQGVEVRPVDVNQSHFDCTLELPTDPTPALRLGLRLVKGLSEAGAKALCLARAGGPFRDVQDLALRGGLSRPDLECLAAADALAGLGFNRHRAFWAVSGMEPPTPVFPVPAAEEAVPLLALPHEDENIAADYASLSLTLRRHPLALLRDRLARRGIRTAEDLQQVPNGAPARAAGLVICRQRPSTASGVTFVTLEDETGQVNLIIWPRTALSERRALLGAALLAVSGVIQRDSEVTHIIAGKLVDLSPWLGRLDHRSRNFR